MRSRCSLALVSLPGARLQELAQSISSDIGLPGASDSGLDAWSSHSAPAIFILPSDVLESGSSALVGNFRQAGNLVFFLDLPWEEAGQPMNP